MKTRNLLLACVLVIVPLPGLTAMGPIVVTPTLVEQQRGLSATPITLIDEETIAQSGAITLAELLRGQAGLHISDLFGDGSQATIDLRGFGPTAASNTLILVDGVRLNNSSDSSVPDLSTINLEDVRQIEILQGSAGVLYGNQAVGGVVNIILKKIDDDRIVVGMKVGSYDSRQLNASIHKNLDDTRLAINASDTSSHNYRDHNNADKQHFSVRATHQFESFAGYIELANTDDHILTPGALLKSELQVSSTQSLPVYANDYFDTQTDVMQIGMEKKVDSNQSLRVDFVKRINDREFIQSFRPSPGTLSTQDRDTRALSGKYVIVLENMNDSTLALGFNAEQTDYKLVTSIGPQKIDQSINDLYVAADWNLSVNQVLSTGVRSSDQNAKVANDNFDDSVSAISLGFTQRIGNWKLNARADQNFRYATVEEHSNVPFGSPPGLKTQEGLSLELGAEYAAHNNRYRATLYSIDLDNEIAFDSSGFSNLNLDSTMREGLILEASKLWTNKFSTGFSLTMLDAEITDGAFKGKNLPLVPEKTLRLDGAYQISETTHFILEIIAVDEQVLGGDFANQLGKLPAYTVLNSNLSYRLKQWDLDFRINNLLDEEYSESGSQFSDFSAFPTVTNYESSFPSPQRNFWVSARYSF